MTHTSRPWCTQDRFLFGSTNPSYSQSLAYATSRPEAPLICFHFWNAITIPSPYRIGAHPRRARAFGGLQRRHTFHRRLHLHAGGASASAKRGPRPTMKDRKSNDTLAVGRCPG